MELVEGEKKSLKRKIDLLQTVPFPRSKSQQFLNFADLNNCTREVCYTCVHDQQGTCTCLKMQLETELGNWQETGSH